MKFLLILLLIASCGAAYADEKAKPKIPNYDLEAAGLLSSDLQGAFPKSIWKDQPRSEVQFLLESMPAESNSRALQQLKKEFLVSKIDTRLIKNDIKIKQYRDIFALRIKKLMQLGLYDDAFTLFTNNIPKAETSELAEIGLLLVLDRKGIPTACLDAKVMSAEFEINEFWDQFSKICGVELGTSDEVAFDTSSILQSLYFEKGFAIPASFFDLLKGLSPLELTILFKKHAIDYDAEFADKIRQSPPILTRFFLNDEKFPVKWKETLVQHAKNQNLLPKEYAKPELENWEESSQQDLVNAIRAGLLSGESIPEDWVKRLKTLAAEHPENYVFIDFLSALRVTSTEFNVPEERFDQGLSHFPEKSAKKLKFLKTLLDKESKFSNNPASVYEKRLVLSEDEQIILPEESGQNWWSEWQKEAESQNFIGLSFLIALNNNDQSVEEQSSDIMLNVLSSMTTVGLIEKSHHLSKVIVANMMEYKEGE